mmetsp:Transcript_7034/g.23320  ORF Transcript_7034/g.23320 Transcript_7034/m.23320 type:complete len:219 (-) Transcript_7034:238-894(-)
MPLPWMQTFKTRFRPVRLFARVDTTPPRASTKIYVPRTTTSSAKYNRKRRILQSAPPAVKCLKFTTRYPWMIIATGIKVKMINPISTTPIRSAEITTWTYNNTAVGRTFQKPWIPGKSTQLRVVDNTRNVILPPRKLLAGRHAAKTRSPLMLTMNSWRSSTTSGTFWPLKIPSANSSRATLFNRKPRKSPRPYTPSLMRSKFSGVASSCSACLISSCG